MKCPYCNKELEIIEVAFDNLKHFTTTYYPKKDVVAITKCCKNMIKLECRVSYQFSIECYSSKKEMPYEDAFGNKLGEDIIRE